MDYGKGASRQRQGRREELRAERTEDEVALKDAGKRDSGATSREVALGDLACASRVAVIGWNVDRCSPTL